MEYDVLSYSEANLAKVLAWKVSVGSIKQKAHYKYFLEYFSKSGLDAKTILVERNYISRAYFSDFSNYYSVCFKDYPRLCRRIHFFNKPFDSTKFQQELFNAESEFLAKSYLGYIVVKPLPESIIGPTILRTYDLAKARFYNSSRNYDINLFGRHFKLDSMAFQEQDTVVSACASTAIWNAFHKTADMFQTPLPSPSEITKSAGNFYNHSGRIFPNQGLDLSQICKAIESVGLVSELRVEGRIDITESGREEIIKSDIPYARRIVYAYNKAELPVLLFIQIDGNGHHLITVNGFSEKDEDFEKTENMTLKADRIERFYAHDDQVGPFARITIENTTSLKTAWRDEAGKLLSGKIYAIIIPLYSKIRISFDDVYKKIRILDIILYRLDIFKFELEWDIYLTESNKYKEEILKSPYSQNLKEKIVYSNFPRYIWITRAIVKKNFVFDLIFDSTDISRGYFCKDFLLYEPSAKAILKKAFLDRKDVIFDDGSPLALGKDLFKIIKSALS